MSLFGFLRKKPAPSKPVFPLQLHNTLSGALEPFVPLSPREVKMYNCGPTVYDRATIGNLRSYVFADLLRRTLDLAGYKVKQVINITDVGHLVSDADEGDDKMEVSAKKQSRSAQDIAAEYTNAFFDDLDKLGIDRSKIEFPKATDFIGEQIALVKALEEKGYAYRIKDGIYFDTARFPSYGKLGGIQLSSLKGGARVEENKEKRSPHDFALWKLSGKKSRQQEWNSPWGKGFPGWHIECTAFVFKLLGRQIDIHTGGIDHIPIHHNNEIAQAEALTGKRYVKYWLHNEFITIEGKRIGKSVGNTIYLSQLVERGFPALALRYWYLTAHYRTPVNFTWDALEGAAAALNRLYRHYFEELSSEKTGNSGTIIYDSAAGEQFRSDFLTALGNDLGTPQALARVWDMLKDGTLSPAEKKASLLYADRALGLGLSGARPSSKLSVLKADDLPEEVRALVSEREAARSAKDFATADELRTKIEGAGFEITDTAEGPRLNKK